MHGRTAAHSYTAEACQDCLGTAGGPAGHERCALLSATLSGCKADHRSGITDLDAVALSHLYIYFFTALHYEAVFPLFAVPCNFTVNCADEFFDFLAESRGFLHGWV